MASLPSKKATQKTATSAEGYLILVYQSCRLFSIPGTSMEVEFTTNLLFGIRIIVYQGVLLQLTDEATTQPGISYQELQPPSIKKHTKQQHLSIHLGGVSRGLPVGGMPPGMPHALRAFLHALCASAPHPFVAGQDLPMRPGPCSNPARSIWVGRS